MTCRFFLRVSEIEAPVNLCSRLVVASVLSLLIGQLSRADDWPQWLGPKRDGVWRETGIIDKFPAGGPPIRWRAPIGGGYTGPAVAEGRVYVMDRQLAKKEDTSAKPQPGGKRPAGTPGSERVLCLSAADGKLLWKHEYDCPYTVQYPAGPRTTPVVHEHKVYTLGTEGNLFCLDAEKGTVLWSHYFKTDYGAKTPMWGFAAHPLLNGQKLICMVGGEGSTVVAFDKDTGKERWRALSAKEPGYCPPMIYEAGGKRQLIVWHSDAVNGLDPETGKVYWSQPANTLYAMSISTPRKQGDLLFLTAVQNTSLLLRLGSQKPSAEVVWRGRKDKGASSVFSAPFFENGYIYASDHDGYLRCIKADTGERLWGTLAPNNGQKARIGDVFIVKNGDRFFLATEKGDLIIARLSPKGYEEVSRAHVLEPTSSAWNEPVVWSHPAFANRCVYARNDKEILCVSLAASAEN